MATLTNIRLEQVRETLDLNILRDSATNLPLLGERDKILGLVQAYLPLPYDVAEFGCGKKCNIILKRLVDFGIPAYALKRGMIMERDMSAAALAEDDFNARKYALVVENPLFHLVNFSDGSLRAMLQAEGVEVSGDNKEIYAGDFRLSHQKMLQFRHARSHVFAIVTFWDEEKGEASEKVIDPTIRSDTPFRVTLMRRLLNSNEGLIFTAPLLGHFRLEDRYLTKNQKWAISKLTKGRSLMDLSFAEWRELVLELTGAEPGSLGDPGEWSYANNYPSGEQYFFENQREHTGRGDDLRRLFRALLTARARHEGEALRIRDQLQTLERELGLYDRLREDARWAEAALEALADVDHTIAFHEALSKFKALLEEDRIYAILTNGDQLEQLTGLARKLQERIETLAILSKNSDGEVDARALNEPFNLVVLDTIRQMNRAGLRVFIDQVGNIHGLMVDEVRWRAWQTGEMSLRDMTATAICHCSHVDTVKDAGKYDGRLGVLSGIQIADILHALRTYFGLELWERQERALMVSAFIGEEMTFTGESVSMPGSAAVTGAATPEQVYAMRNGEGDRFGDKLVDLLRLIRAGQEKGDFVVENDFRSAESADALLEACFRCTDFFTPHTYERHIEQGPVLDRRQRPLALVKAIMGIHQEDFLLVGERAEEAALALNLGFRRGLRENGYDDQLRATVGIMRDEPESRQSIDHSFALHWILQGSKNHAGATLLEDRQDPGVAAARLAAHFRALVTQMSHERGKEWVPTVGGINLIPGTNRNVIPDNIGLTLGVAGEVVDPPEQHQLIGALQHFVFGTLAKTVKEGGEGISGCQMEAIDFSHRAGKMRVSVDLRGATQELVDRYLQSVDQVVASLETKYQVTIERSLEQRLMPFALSESGQVLQIERSYGGSHNPNEAQLINDLLRGTLLSLAISLEWMAVPVTDVANLYRMVAEHMPEAWKLDRPFVSGALHDTCNIAARVQRAQSPP